MRPDWVRLPSTWINERGLASFKWEHGGAGADHTAALMLLTVLAHNADQINGRARITYDDFCEHTGLSRAKVSNGLALLERQGLINRPRDAGQSIFHLTGYDPALGWAKFPAKSMYSGDVRIRAFADFRLRKVVELDALKLFFLFVARRDNKTNMASISYPKIEEYTGILNVRIKTAISYLASHSLVFVEHIPRANSEYGVANLYRLAGIDPYSHMGTRGRTLDTSDFER